MGTKGGIAVLVKKGIVVNQEWENEHFDVITDNEVLAVEIELQNGDKVILATIYCPNGNPSSRPFMHFRTKLFLTQNMSNLDVSNQTNLVKRLLI